jgi:hypothetical protein
MHALKIWYRIPPNAAQRNIVPLVVNVQQTLAVPSLQVRVASRDLIVLGVHYLLSVCKKHKFSAQVEVLVMLTMPYVLMIVQHLHVLAICSLAAVPLVAVLTAMMIKHARIINV